MMIFQRERERARKDFRLNPASDVSELALRAFKRIRVEIIGQFLNAYREHFRDVIRRPS